MLTTPINKCLKMLWDINILQLLLIKTLGTKQLSIFYFKLKLGSVELGRVKGSTYDLLTHKHGSLSFRQFAAWPWAYLFQASTLAGSFESNTRLVLALSCTECTTLHCRRMNRTCFTDAYVRTKNTVWAKLSTATEGLSFCSSRTWTFFSQSCYQFWPAVLCWFWSKVNNRFATPGLEVSKALVRISVIIQTPLSYQFINF